MLIRQPGSRASCATTQVYPAGIIEEFSAALNLNLAITAVLAV